MSITSGIRSGVISGIRSGINAGYERGPIVPAHLYGNSSTTDGASFDFAASVTPTPMALQLLILTAIEGDVGTIPQPVVTGCGLTWVFVKEGTGARRLMVYRAMGAAPTAGVITMDFTGIGSSVDSIIYSLTEFTGVDTSGTNGSGAIVQSVHQTNIAATTATLTLAALENAANVNVTAVMNPLQAAITHDPLFAELSDKNEANYAGGMNVQWAVNRVACTPTWTNAATQMIGIEIKAA